MSRAVTLSLATWAPGHMGGSERCALALVRALGELRDPSLDLSLVVPRGVTAGGLGLPVAARVPRVADGGAPRAAGLLAGLALGGRRARRAGVRADVVHHLFTIPALRPAARSVVTLYDVAHHDVPDHFGRAERAFRSFAYDRAARRADAVVTASEHAARRLVAVLGLDPARVHVIGLGVDHDRFHPAAADGVPTRPGLPERYVLYPANLWPHKNHLRLVRALADTEDRGLGLVLTGRPSPALEGIRAAARDAGVAERVTHLGHVEDAELAALYVRARALVVPSLYEGYGLPALEAMACGTPVAVAGGGALADVAGDAALVFDPTDEAAITAALDAVTTDGTDRDRRRERGLTRAAQATWQASARAHVALYRGLESRP